MSQPAKSYKPAYVHAVSPHLVCAGAAKAIDFYKKAFGAEEVMRINAPDGKLMHACLTINGSSVMLVDEFPQMGALSPAGLKMSPVTIHLFVPDVDAFVARAVEAGAQVTMPVMDMMWGDRYGTLVDPFGHRWSVATHKIEMSPAEMQKAMDEAMAAMAQGGHQGCGEIPTETGAFSITRALEAPRDLVWQLFTQAEHLKQWWGPKGFAVTHASIDAAPGGRFHYGLRSANGDPIWGLFVFREVTAPERLVFINSFSDENGGVTRHPLSQTWPLELSSRFEFEDLGNTTRVKVTWRPLNPSPEEKKTFEESFASMQAGWSGTLEQLEAYIAQLNRKKAG